MEQAQDLIIRLLVWTQLNWIPMLVGAFAGGALMFLFVLIRRKVLYGRAFGPIARYDRQGRSLA